MVKNKKVQKILHEVERLNGNERYIFVLELPKLLTEKKSHFTDDQIETLAHLAAKRQGISFSSASQARQFLQSL